MIIRNFLSYNYDFYTGFSLSNYSKSLGEQKSIGIQEIEHYGRRLSKKQLLFSEECINIIHEKGMRAVLYSGTFGTENLILRPEFEKYAQRDKKGELLSYGNNKKTVMMCPGSDYSSEILVPELLRTLNRVDYDSIFFDMPWIMKKGCYCKNCGDLSKKEKVRNSLEEIVVAIRKEHSRLDLGINASMPLLNRENLGGQITNLVPLFDHYITEWNPYRWNQHAESIEKSLKKAKKTTGKSQMFHSTTITNKKGKILSSNQLTTLFSVIREEEYSLRLSFKPREKLLSIINNSLILSQNI